MGVFNACGWWRYFDSSSSSKLNTPTTCSFLGTHARTEKYALSAITNKLHLLKAPLMINHGTADDDVPIEETYKFIEALKTIGYKNYLFNEYTGMDHIIMRDKNWEPGMINFFIKHLKD